MQSVPSGPSDMKNFQHLLRKDNGVEIVKDKRGSEDPQSQTPWKLSNIFETMTENSPRQGYQVRHSVI